MSPKIKVLKQEIIDAAFTIASEEGFSALSVRKVAAMLDCSVAPIYVNFESVEDLHAAVAERAKQIHMDMCAYPHTDEPFLNMGIGCIKFAYEYKRLYKDIIEPSNYAGYTSDCSGYDMHEMMRKDPKLVSFDESALTRILFKMGTFTNGLCVYAAANPMPEGITLELLLDVLEQTGNDVINGELKRQKEAQ